MLQHAIDKHGSMETHQQGWFFRESCLPSHHNISKFWLWPSDLQNMPWETLCQNPEPLVSTSKNTQKCKYKCQFSTVITRWYITPKRSKGNTFKLRHLVTTCSVFSLLVEAGLSPLGQQVCWVVDLGLRRPSIAMVTPSERRLWHSSLPHPHLPTRD